MCRFALYLGEPIRLGSLVTEPANSIIHQSFHSHESIEPLNGDGFGIAWYAPETGPEPALFKDVTPAWSDQNLLHLARVTRSSCLFAHVRAATPGMPVTRLNCHPFSWGPFCMMHNGRLGGFRKIERRLRGQLSEEAYLRIEGSTDSEHLFALFCDLWSARPAEEPPLERMTGALLDAIARVEELKREAGVEDLSLVNVALADGRRAVATRWTSGEPTSAYTLYYRAGSRYECSGGDGRFLDAGLDGAAVVVASEPLTDDLGWRRVPPNHLVAIDESLAARIRPIAL